LKKTSWTFSADDIIREVWNLTSRSVGLVWKKRKKISWKVSAKRSTKRLIEARLMGSLSATLAKSNNCDTEMNLKRAKTNSFRGHCFQTTCLDRPKVVRARFSWCYITKGGKYTKRPQDVPNWQKIYQIAKNIIEIAIK
jgi:hypothetical protein